MTIYTVIAYRPDYDDYCKGCYMGGSPSEQEIEAFDDQDAAARFIADKHDAYREDGFFVNFNETHLLVIKPLRDMSGRFDIPAVPVELRA